MRIDYKERPVADIDIYYQWQKGLWMDIFDEQIKLIRHDVLRALEDDKLIFYLSCPISARGGGYHCTNVEIAKDVERRLLERWGHRFWILNPVNYQMESGQGAGLLHRHMKQLNIDEALLEALPRPSGGDYMRMWTKILVEDQQDNCGRLFSGYYFVGPNDAHKFFYHSGAKNLSTALESYYSRKISIDNEFRNKFLNDAKSTRNFLCFYGVKSSAFFSLGCHDEWHIFCKLNQKRLAYAETAILPNGDPGDLLSGYFDGMQFNPTAVPDTMSKGYGV